VNDGDGNGTRCGGIKIRTDTTKLSNIVIASGLCRWIKGATAPQTKIVNIF